MNTKQRLLELKDKYNVETIPCRFNGIYVGTGYRIYNNYAKIETFHRKAISILIRYEGRKNTKGTKEYSVTVNRLEVSGCKYKNNLSFSEAVRFAYDHMYNPIVSA